jgi:hypothetical protein
MERELEEKIKKDKEEARLIQKKKDEEEIRAINESQA